MASSDISAVTNLIPTPNEGFTTTVAAPGVTSGGTTVPLASVSGLTNATVFVGIVEPGLTNEQTFTGTVDTAGVQITGVKWTRGSNVAHAAGVTIVDYVTGTGFKMLAKAASNHIDQDGTLSAGAVDGAAVLASNVVTTAKINALAVTDAKINDVSAIKLTNPYKFSVNRNAVAQTVSANVQTVILFTTKVFDTGTNIDVVTNKGRFTAPVSGFYFFNAAVSCSVSSYCLPQLLKNGSLALSGGETTSSAGSMAATVSGFIQLSATDYVELAITTSATNVNGTNPDTYFQGFLVSTT